VVGGEQFVAWAEPQTARHDVQPDGAVIDVDEIVAFGPQISGELGARIREALGRPSRQKIDWLAFELALPTLIAFEDWPRRRPVSTVIEVGDRRIEKERLFQSSRHTTTRRRVAYRVQV